jgi:hypothetical protein
MLITVKYNEGRPQMIVHISSGDHAEMLDKELEILEHWNRGISRHGEQAMVKGEVNDDKSIKEVIAEESEIYEETSLEDESEPKETDG